VRGDEFRFSLGLSSCKDVTHLLTYVDSSLLLFDQQEALAKVLKQVKGHAALVIMGSLKGWGTASHMQLHRAPWH
jgi:hypothetical protein